MIVLGFDTATSATAVAVRLADGETLDARDDPREGEGPGHATRLLSLADELLSQAGIGWSALQRIAVGVGPGRFTGLRVGVATAHGLARSLALDLVGVPSLRALALGASRSHARRPLLAVIDARRGEVFAAAYADGAPELDFGAPLRPHELPDAVARAAALAAGDKSEGACVAVGDGAVGYREQLERAGATVPTDGDGAHLIGADAICELAALAPASAARGVVPDYRRDADAAVASKAAVPLGGAPR